MWDTPACAIDAPDMMRTIAPREQAMTTTAQRFIEFNKQTNSLAATVIGRR
jgi:hypothetical protein